LSPRPNKMKKAILFYASSEERKLASSDLIGTSRLLWREERKERLRKFVRNSDQSRIEGPKLWIAFLKKLPQEKKGEAASI